MATVAPSRAGPAHPRTGGRSAVRGHDGGGRPGGCRDLGDGETPFHKSVTSLRDISSGSRHMDDTNSPVRFVASVLPLLPREALENLEVDQALEDILGEFSGA